MFQCRERTSLRHPSLAVNTCRLLVCFAHAVRDLFVQVLWVVQGGIERRFCERVLLQGVSFSGSSPGCAPHKTTTGRVRKHQRPTNYVASFTGLRKDVGELLLEHLWHRLPVESAGIEAQPSIFFNAVPIDQLARNRLAGISFNQIFMAVTTMLRTSFEQDIAAMTRILRIQDYDATPWPTRLGATKRRFLPSVHAVAQHLRLLALVEDQPRQSSCLSFSQLITIRLHDPGWVPTMWWCTFATRLNHKESTALVVPDQPLRICSLSLQVPA